MSPDLFVLVSISGLPAAWIPTPGHLSGLWASGPRASRQICPELQDPAAGRLGAGRAVKSNPELGSGEALESERDGFFLPVGQYRKLASVELRIPMLASTRFTGPAVFLETFLNVNETLKQKVDSENHETLIVFFFSFFFLEANGWTCPHHQGELQVERRQPCLLRLWQREPSQRRQLPSNVLLCHPVGRTSLSSVFLRNFISFTHLLEWNYDHSSYGIVIPLSGFYISFSLLEPTGCKRLTLTS